MRNMLREQKYESILLRNPEQLFCRGDMNMDFKM